MSRTMFHGTGSSLKFHRLLVVIKQTAYEEYSQLKLRGQAPKALRWKRLESRYKAHKQCVNDLLATLRHHKVDFNCVTRVELDRQHLANVDLVVAVGGDGTVLSAAHFLDHGTIPLLGVNVSYSDPISRDETKALNKKTTDERRSHGALCMCTSHDMHHALSRVLYGGGNLSSRARLRCVVKGTFSETILVPALNDLLVANPSPAAVSRFRMGFVEPVNTETPPPLGDVGGGGAVNGVAAGGNDHPAYDHFSSHGNGPGGAANGGGKAPISKTYGTVTRFAGQAYDVKKSINVWSSGMWVCTSTGSSAAMAAAGGSVMDIESKDVQYLVREHMLEADADETVRTAAHGFVKQNESLHIRWNSQRGRIFIDGAHMSHDLELGDEILINSNAPPLQLFLRDRGEDHSDSYDRKDSSDPPNDFELSKTHGSLKEHGPWREYNPLKEYERLTAL